MSRKNAVAPTCEERGEERNYHHPAYGQITLSKVQGGGGTSLFGSDLLHHNRVRIKIHEAHVSRSLSRDWRHTGRVLCEFEMSEAQWAHFVSSQGLGEGTPITLQYKPAAGAQIEAVPDILPAENEKEAHRREMRDEIARRLAELGDVAADIKSLIDSGKANKGQLVALLSKVNKIGSLPGVADFIASSFDESMERTVEAGKVEIEAFISNLAHRTGIEALKNGTVRLLAQTKDDTHESD